MENLKEVKIEKTLFQWMVDADISDADLADILEVKRQTAWRWRTKGHVPHSRERKKIEALAGCDIIFGVCDEKN